MERDSYSDNPNTPADPRSSAPVTDEGLVVMQTKRNTYPAGIHNVDDELVDVTEDN